MELSKEERIAALLDGRCTEEERREILAELAADGEDAEAFADVAAVLYEMEAEDRAETEVIPLRPSEPVVATAPAPPRRPPRIWRPAVAVGGFLLAAGIAALIVLRPNQAEASGPAAVLDRLTRHGGPVPERIALAGDEPLRGPERGLTDVERVRLGMWLVELEAAVRTGDSARVATAAEQVARLVGRTGDPGGLADHYRALGGHEIPSGGLDPKLAQRAEDLSGGVTATRFGEWLQVASIAARRRDLAFFQTGESPAWLAAQGLPEPLKAAVAPDLQGARDAVNAPTPDWATVTASLTKVLDAIGS